MISLHFGFIFGFHSRPHNTCEHTETRCTNNAKNVCELKWLAVCRSLSFSYTMLLDKGRPKNLHFSEFDDKPWCDTKHYKVQILVLYLAINHHRWCQLFSAKLIHKFACYIQLQPLKNLQLTPFKSIRFGYGIDIEIRDKPRSFGNFALTDAMYHGWVQTAVENVSRFRTEFHLKMELQGFWWTILIFSFS